MSKNKKSATITQEQFAYGISVVSKAVSNKSVLPILSNVRLLFSHNNLTIFGTDLEIGIVTKVSCEFCDEFETTVPAKMLSDLLATVQGQNLKIEYDEVEGTFEVKGARSKQKIRTLPASSFPDIPSVDAPWFHLPASEFKPTIQRIVFSASESESQPVLSSVVFRLENERLTIFAADGFRSAYRFFEVPNLYKDGSKTVIVPANSVGIAASIAEGANIDFHLMESSIAFQSGATIVFSQTIGGKAIDEKMIHQVVESVLLAEDASFIVVNTKEFSALCKQAEIFSEKNENKLLRVSIQGTKLTISAEGQEIGSSEGYIEGQGSQGSVETGMNSAYLREFLNACKSEFLKITTKPKNPIVFVVPEFDEYYHMIMPIALPKKKENAE